MKEGWIIPGLLRAAIVVPAVVAFAHFNELGLWLFAFASLSCAVMPTLDRIDAAVPGPRWTSHVALYGPYLVYAAAINFALLYWGSGLIAWAIGVAKTAPEQVQAIPVLWKELQELLREDISDETAQKILGYLKEFASNNGKVYGLALLGIMRAIAVAIFVLYLVALLLPLVLLVVHTTKEQEVGMTASAVATVLGGSDTPQYRVVAHIWARYTSLLGRIFIAMAKVAVICAVVYTLTLVCLKLFFVSTLTWKSIFGYGLTLGVMSSAPLVGGLTNWGIVGLVGWQGFGLTLAFALLAIVQLLVHQIENNYLTPKVMGRELEVNMLGMILAYVEGIYFFGFSVSGVIMSFLMIPMNRALIEAIALWGKDGEHFRAQA